MKTFLLILGENFLVMCECCEPDGALTPIKSNTRNYCASVMEQAAEHKPWFGTFIHIF
jgi:hypothetical protein